LSSASLNKNSRQLALTVRHRRGYNLTVMISSLYLFIYFLAIL